MSNQNLVQQALANAGYELVRADTNTSGYVIGVLMDPENDTNSAWLLAQKLGIRALHDEELGTVTAYIDGTPYTDTENYADFPGDVGEQQKAAGRLAVLKVAAAAIPATQG